MKSMRYIILHHHFFKNAGSTVEEILDQSFGDRFARLDSAVRDHVCSQQELIAFLNLHPATAAVSSHQIRYPMPLVPGLLLFDICFLRDPVDRIRSMYEYFRKRPAPGDPVSDIANESTPGDFVARLIDENPLQVRDVQVNLLAAGGDSDGPTDADLETAKRCIREASFPGVVDMFRESVLAGEYYLRQVFPEFNCAVPPANVSAELDGSRRRNIDLAEECVPSVFAELLRLNRLDLALLDAARAEVRQRFASIPAPVEHETAIRAGANCGELFDPAFYLLQNPDVAAARIDPLKHYIRHGSAEGRKPHPYFQPDYYLAQHPEAGSGNGNPLLYYLKTGKGNPHRLFDADSCRAAYRANGSHPLLEYLALTPASGTCVVDDVPLSAGNQVPTRRFLKALNYRQREKLELELQS